MMNIRTETQFREELAVCRQLIEQAQTEMARLRVANELLAAGLRAAEEDRDLLRAAMKKLTERDVPGPDELLGEHWQG